MYQVLDVLKKSVIPIHKEGILFILILVVLTVLFSFISPLLTFLSGLLTIGCICFFRDPERIIPQEDNLIVSPADGIVQNIQEEVPSPKGLTKVEKDQKWTRISIFLSIFNVHVNRIPIAGKIIELHYHPGKFLNASLNKASEENERQICVVETQNNQKVIFTQIAGLIARRIVCNLNKEQKVKTGERYGIILFGSRCDIYVPKGVKIKVLVGQTMIGGETVIAELTPSPVKKLATIKPRKTTKTPSKVSTKK